mmetsp:Transcript_49379/g.148729  ORF Transcript_49379/g.148729 Transcript_49379/m.148729 type:complete len:254 (+) Transcript_49379:1849-2610(+)
MAAEVEAVREEVQAPLGRAAEEATPSLSGRSSLSTGKFEIPSAAYLRETGPGSSSLHRVVRLSGTATQLRRPRGTGGASARTSPSRPRRRLPRPPASARLTPRLRERLRLCHRPKRHRRRSTVSPRSRPAPQRRRSSRRHRRRLLHPARLQRLRPPSARGGRTRSPCPCLPPRRPPRRNNSSRTSLHQWSRSNRCSARPSRCRPTSRLRPHRPRALLTRQSHLRVRRRRVAPRPCRDERLAPRECQKRARRAT